VQEGKWPRIAVLGAGAVGCYFGGMLARAGAPVTLIGRPLHVEAIARNGLFLESRQFHEWIRVTASGNLSDVSTAQIVLLCVKTLDTEEAVRALAPHFPPEAILVSLQNGVDNIERIRRAVGIEALPAVVYVAAEMTGPGRVKHNGRGDLVIGDPAGKTMGQMEKLAAMFGRAGIPCRISKNIQADLWTKLIMNCAYNPISALARARYGRIVDNPATRELMRQVTEEVMAVARAAEVRFPDGDMVQAVYQLGRAMANAVSSTAQDLARGKRTEIDSLNGYVARRGAELGVPVPVNQTLYSLVKLLEESSMNQSPVS
jgi:2-dehydropantoate 2-reductase